MVIVNDRCGHSYTCLRSSEGTRPRVPRRCRASNPTLSRSARGKTSHHCSRDCPGRISIRPKSERSRSIQDIVGQAFFIAPFDTQAADIAAQLFDKRVSDSIRQGNVVTRDALKDDYKILATAICQGATYLYTHDPWIAQIEQKGITSRPVKVVPLPAFRPRQCSFFDDDEPQSLPVTND